VTRGVEHYQLFQRLQRQADSAIAANAPPGTVVIKFVAQDTLP
jgi:hypothetical protein